MTATAKRTLIDRYVAAYNRFDVDAMLETVHPQVRFENVSGGAVTAATVGAEALRETAEQGASLFASRHQTVTAFEDGDGGAAIEIDYEGTLARDLPGGPSAGETVHIEARTEFAFADGRISRIRDVS